MDFYTFRLSLVSDRSEYHNGPQIMAALGFTCQGQPAIHALEAGGLLCLLAPGVPAHEALHVFDLDVQVQALGAPLLGLPEGAVGLRDGRLPPPSDGAGLLVNVNVVGSVLDI